jgi:putative ABC transport system substrate-binding protein
MSAIRKYSLEGSRKALSTLLFAINLFSGIFLSFSLFANAQQGEKPFRVGFLSGASPMRSANTVEGFTKALQQLGYVEGQNISIEQRYADGKLSRLSNLARELIELKVDVLVAVGATATAAAKTGPKSSLS